MKIRVQQSPSYRDGESARRRADADGAKAGYTALQQGVVDGGETTRGLCHYASCRRWRKFYSATAHDGAGCLVIGTKVLNKLSDKSGKRYIKPQMNPCGK